MYWLPITAAHFTERTGHQPEQDDLDRVNCPNEGATGHQQCGWCEDCDLPRFQCGHIHIHKEQAMPVPAKLTATLDNVVVETDFGIIFGTVTGFEDGCLHMKQCYSYRPLKDPRVESLKTPYDLAIHGPGEGESIGPAASMWLHRFHAMITCTHEAAEAWERNIR